MKILAIEASAMVASAAILSDGVIIAEYTVDYKKTHSQTLMPMIDEIIRMTETDLSQISAIAVAKGPGSFTGLRIAAATAKGLAMGLNVPIAGVPTLMAMSMGMYMSEDMVCPLLDARRGQVYAGRYLFENGYPVSQKNDELILVTELLEELKAHGKRVIFCGDGAEVHKESIIEALGDKAAFANALNNRQKASYVAWLAAKMLEEGNVCDTFDFEPEYLKETEAQENLRKKMPQ